ncbi:DNA gyrase subunit A [Streptococcus pneumoniae]|nr:DNA gyrase subunit A [Streptococcus pneumoniae]CJN72970.1 DNA gyrase subunit A [Streptococcus pneumoniae]CON49672.1 DNA gyrase subunit A [Streptococcus pneumoniae]
MLITAAGVIIRMPVDQISQMGRNTQGVRLIRLEEDQEVATVAKAQKDEEEETSEEVSSEE